MGLKKFRKRKRFQ